MTNKLPDWPKLLLCLLIILSFPCIAVAIWLHEREDVTVPKELSTRVVGVTVRPVDERNLKGTARVFERPRWIEEQTERGMALMYDKNFEGAERLVDSMKTALATHQIVLVKFVITDVELSDSWRAVWAKPEEGQVAPERLSSAFSAPIPRNDLETGLNTLASPPSEPSPASDGEKALLFFLPPEVKAFRVMNGDTVIVTVNRLRRRQR